LIDLHFLGINNLLILRGDAVKSEKRFTPEPDGHSFAIELVQQISDLNNGKYLDDELQNTTATDFTVGVAAYPEKHAESPNLNFDLRNLKRKIEAGAKYVVTQMFFDNNKYYDFLAHCRSEGINVPIIPGIKPITSKQQMNILPQTFNIEIPDTLALAIERAKSNEEVREIGIEWAIEQSRDLMKNNAPVIHYYTMGLSASVKRICEKVF